MYYKLVQTILYSFISMSITACIGGNGHSRKSSINEEPTKYPLRSAINESAPKQLIDQSFVLSGYAVMSDEATGEASTVAWIDGYHDKKGYQKYFSARNGINTTFADGSPWTDEEKISGHAVRYSGITQDTANPVIASYPIIYTILEGFSLSYNGNKTLGFNVESSVSMTKGQTNTKVHEVNNSNSINFGVNAGASAKDGPHAGINFGYSHTWGTSDTTTVGYENSNTNGYQVGINSDDNFNPSTFGTIGFEIRYINLGTAPIHKFKYDMNISVGKHANKSISIARSNSADNRIIDSLAPYNTYPSSNEPALYSNKGDDFNSSPLTINQNQYNEIINLKNKIFVSHTQLSTATPETDWGSIKDSILRNSTTVILRTPHNEVERNVFAIDDEATDKYNYPQLTLRDMLYVPYQLVEAKRVSGNHNDKGFLYNPSFNKREIPGKYKFDNLMLISDKYTENLLSKQRDNIPVESYQTLADNPSKILDAFKIRAGMKFIISPIGWVINEVTQKRSYATAENGFYRNQVAQIDGKWYLFDANGELVITPGIHEVQEDFQSPKNLYYVGNNNDYSLENGWKTINNDKYFFDLQTYQAKKNEWVIQNNKCQDSDRYYIGNEYKLLSSGFTTIDDKLYFLSPKEAYFITKTNKLGCDCSEIISNHICAIRGSEYLGVAWKNVPVGPWRKPSAFVPLNFVNQRYMADDTGILTKIK